MSAESGGHYMMYQGGESVYTNTLSHEKKKDCAVCSRCAVTLTVPRNITVAQCIEMMKVSSSSYDSAPQYHGGSVHRNDEGILLLI
jgi:hypothetical protein